MLPGYIFYLIRPCHTAQVPESRKTVAEAQATQDMEDDSKWVTLPMVLGHLQSVSWMSLKLERSLRRAA